MTPDNITYLMVEPTTRCNQNCPSCVNDRLSDERRGDLTAANLRLILAQFPRVKFLTYAGLGEPLLHDDMDGLLSAGKDSHHYLTITTNSTIYPDDCLGCLDKVHFSLNPLTSERFQNIYKYVSQNKPHRQWVNLHCVLYRPEDLFNAQAFALFLDKCVNLSGFWAKITCSFSDVVNYNFEKGVLYASVLEPDRLIAPTCKWPRNGLFITWDGYVLPCCYRMTPHPAYTFGNIYEQTAIEILEGDLYRAYKEGFRTGNYPDYCARCPR